MKAVYITMDSSSMGYVMIWSARIGIAKFKGCHFYGSAVKGDVAKGYKRGIREKECKAKYGSFPAPGEAWLVEEGRLYFHWTRIDQTLYLLDDDFNIVKGE